ncbi:MAG: hypothetical protein KY475_17375 [Planctomycetes bacterium]|nr:hypothetical protein [Planctomycetota bacterium]
MITAKTEQALAGESRTPPLLPSEPGTAAIFRPRTCPLGARVNGDADLHRSFRTLLSRVRTATDQGEPLRTIGFTSCRHGEGVTSIAAGFALVAAGKLRVLLVDAHGSGARAGTTPADGELTSPASPCNGAGRECGGSFLSAEELHRLTHDVAAPVRITRERLKRTLDGLTRQFDLTIFDLPALSEDEAAVEWARLLDGVALVLEAERVRWRTAERNIDLLRQADARIVGVVFNKRKLYVPGWIYRRL